MTAAVVSFDLFRFKRAERIARERAEFLSRLAAELHYASHEDPEQYDGVAYLYAQMGWATDTDLRLAVEALREAEG
jgi:Fe-S oxidoreductase